MEEMLEDTLDMDEDEELTEEADAEVDKVLFQLTNGKLGEAGSVEADLPVSVYSDPTSYTDHTQTLGSKEDEEETERNMEKYRQQLNGLLS